MGWLYTEGQTRAGLIAHLTEGFTGAESGKEFRCLKHHAATGNVLWAVWEITDADGNKERFIRCCLMRSDGRYGWGYKSMDESMGPAYYNCPLSYLDLVPCPDGQWAKEWREKVREYHKKRRRKFKPGEVVDMIDGCSIPHAIITSTRPLVGVHGGKRYRLPRRMIA